MLAAQDGSLEAVEVLLLHGVDINKANPQVPCFTLIDTAQT